MFESIDTRLRGVLLWLWRVFALAVMSEVCLGQNADELVDRIMKRIDRDRSYSNLYAIASREQSGPTFKKISGDSIKFVTEVVPSKGKAKGETVIEYELIYLNHLQWEDSLMPLSIERTITENQVVDPMTGEIRSEKPVKEAVFNVVDFLDLKGNKGELYNTVLAFIKKSRGTPLLSLIANTELERQRVFPENEDRLNYAGIHSNHPFPALARRSQFRESVGHLEIISRGDATTSGEVRPIDHTSAPGNRALGKDTSAAGDTTRRLERTVERGKPSIGYYCDISFSANLWKPLPSAISLSHQVLTRPEGPGLLGVGFEVGVGEDPLLNLLPYQVPYWAGGVRLLFNFTDKEKDLRTGDFVDLKLLFRGSRGNTASFVKYADYARPFSSLSPPKLNVTSGGTVSVSTSPLRLFDWPALPPLTTDFSGGSSDFSTPHTLSEDGLAFFSTLQGEAAFSFYWNTTTDSAFFSGHGRLLNQFRLDVGVGGYSIYKIQYHDNPQKLLSESQQASLWDLKPLVSIEFTHASESAKYGARLRFSDNRFNLYTWMKLLSIGVHELRAEAIYVTDPVGRPFREWETESGHVFQLRYRLGFL